MPTGISVSIAGLDLAFAPTVRNATRTIQTADPAYKPPANGKQFVMVTVTTTNTGKAKASPGSSLSFSFAGSDGVLYGLGHGSHCSFIPNDLLRFTDVPAGETVNGTVCQAVPAAAINGGTWLAAAAKGGMKLSFGLG